MINDVKKARSISLRAFSLHIREAQTRLMRILFYW